MPQRPNILFLFTDDQRFDTLHALGNSYIRTPNMDRIVHRGTAMTHACVQGSTCPAVCLPSRAMLMSGRTLYRAPGDLAGTPTFPQVLRELGYTTFATGKWHNERESFARSFDAGGSIFFGGMSDHLQVPVYEFSGEGSYPSDAHTVGKAFSSELFSDRAIDFLQRHDTDDPFLMYVAFTAPHDPRMAPPEWAALYRDEEMPLPPNFMAQHPFDNGELRIRDELLAPFPRTPQVVREHLAAYYAMITHLDFHIGRVLDALETSGHAANTVIVFAGDNGLAVGQHGLLGKQSLYDHSARVPLVFAGPGIPAGERRQAQCYLLDIFPTLFDMIGLPMPDAAEGLPLTPVIRGHQEQVRDSLFLAYRELQRGVREQNLKLIEYNVAGQRTTQLFDLADDPWELRNLAGGSEHAEDVARLRARLAQWQVELDDPTPMALEW